jgi:hypothetical protein
MAYDLRMLSRYLAVALLLTACADKPTPDTAANAERVKRGPYVATSKEISDHETMRVVIVPHPLGPHFDTACVVYTNRDFKTSSMQCPDADKQSLLDTAQP